MEPTNDSGEVISCRDVDANVNVLFVDFFNQRFCSLPLNLDYMYIFFRYFSFCDLL